MPAEALSPRSLPASRRKAARWLPAAPCRGLALLWVFAVSRLWAVGSIDDLTGPWQLLVDDYLIAAKTNVARTYHPFQKYAGNPVLVPQQAWEQLTYIYGTVLPNETRTGYRMWYQTLRKDPPCTASSTQLYATSTDGIYWVKPALGQIDWCGSTANNMYYQGFMTSVMHTPWDPDPAKVYKLMNFGTGGWSVAWSSNGINFVSAPNNPVFTAGSDSGQACWDPRTQQYRLYVKNTWVDANGLNRRAVALASTANFTNWPATGALVLWPDAFDDRWSLNVTQRTHFYGLSAFPYETMYLGFLWIHRATNLTSSPPGLEGYQIGPIFDELVSSRDGVHWTREEGNRPPILALGAANTWDAGMVFTPRAPVAEGNTIKIWYGGFKSVHDTAFTKQQSAIGLAMLRKDGFASLDAGATAATILTKTFGNTGGALLVNYHTNNSSGWVKVEALDENGNVLSGYSQADCVPLTGNSTTQAVTWVGHSELPAGQRWLRLRFLLQNASIYSFMMGTNAALVEVPPALGYGRRDNEIVLSWPTNSAGFALEYTTNLPPPAWTPALPSPVIIGTQYVVTNSMTGAERNYRLRGP